MLGTDLCLHVKEVRQRMIIIYIYIVPKGNQKRKWHKSVLIIDQIVFSLLTSSMQVFEASMDLEDMGRERVYLV